MKRIWGKFLRGLRDWRGLWWAALLFVFFFFCQDFVARWLLRYIPSNAILTNGLDSPMYVGAELAKAGRGKRTPLYVLGGSSTQYAFSNEPVLQQALGSRFEAHNFAYPTQTAIEALRIVKALPEGGVLVRGLSLYGVCRPEPQMKRSVLSNPLIPRPIDLVRDAGYSLPEALREATWAFPHLVRVARYVFVSHREAILKQKRWVGFEHKAPHHEPPKRSQNFRVSPTMREHYKKQYRKCLARFSGEGSWEYRLAQTARDKGMRVIYVQAPMHEELLRIAAGIFDHWQRFLTLKDFEYWALPQLPSSEFLDALHLHERGAAKHTAVFARRLRQEGYSTRP